MLLLIPIFAYLVDVYVSAHDDLYAKHTLTCPVTTLTLVYSHRAKATALSNVL